MSKLTYERVHENLRTLDLSSIEDSLDNFLESSADKDKNFMDLLDELLQEEVAARKRRGVVTRTRLSGLPFHKRIEDFDFSFQPSVDKKLIGELQGLRFLHNAENVLFLGPPGVGKTHLAVGLAMEAIRAGFKVYYTSASDMILNLRKAEAQGRLDRKMRSYTRLPLLVIDEIGYLPLDHDGAHLLFRVVADRYEKVSTVFTSNKSFSEWGEILGDSVLATAVLDRVLHHCTVVNITGKSYRLKNRKRLGLPSESTREGGRKV